MIVAAVLGIALGLCSRHGGAGPRAVAAEHPRVGAPARPGFQVESLLVAAHRAARAWFHHEFAALLVRSDQVVLHLPRSDPSAPVGASQAEELLRAFADGAEEVEVDVMVARNLDPDRAYVEARRVFVVRGTTARRTQTVYFGMRRDGASYRVAEIRVIP